MCVFYCVLREGLPVCSSAALCADGGGGELRPREPGQPVLHHPHRRHQRLPEDPGGHGSLLEEGPRGGPGGEEDGLRPKCLDGLSVNQKHTRRSFRGSLFSHTLNGCL